MNFQKLVLAQHHHDDGGSIRMMRHSPLNLDSDSDSDSGSNENFVLVSFFSRGAE
jgi:hypothetical protein